MSDALNTLLSLDRLAQLTGAGLKPKLRATLEQEGRFKSKSSGPTQPLSSKVDAENLPYGVVLFPNGADDQRRKG